MSGGAAVKGKVLIVSATSGVSRAVARAAREHGYEVVLAGRDAVRTCAEAQQSGAEVAPMQFDALREDEHPQFVDAVFRAHPNITGCFISYGIMPTQARMLSEPTLCGEMLQVNFNSVVSLVNALVPRLRDRHGAFISCVTSVAGDRGRKSNFLYGSAKAGLNTFLEGLRYSLTGSALLIQTVKLGPVDTPMNAGTKPPLMISAERAASAILRAIQRRREVVYVPFIWSVIMVVLRLMPKVVFRRLGI